MIVGMLVLPLGSSGMTEASTTRSPSIPRTRSSAFNDRRGSNAHRTGTYRVVAVSNGSTQKLLQFLIGPRIRTGHQLVLDQVGERFVAKELTRIANGPDHRVNISLFSKHVKQDTRLVARIVGAQFHPAS